MHNFLTQWSRLIIGTLADAGIQDLVISPGSRSTPFIVAACGEPRIRCHSVIDERSASFVALGQARVTGRASALLCTSGTALAHYLPALIEASLCDVPLLVLSADRPHEMQHCAAAQTIDQIKIFGDYVRCYFDLAAPDGDYSTFLSGRRTIAQGVAATLGTFPGPVHINLRARKPLEPVDATTDAERALVVVVDSLLARPLPLVGRSVVTPPAAALDDACERIIANSQGVIACGPASLDRQHDITSICMLSRASGYPVFVEATSQLRFAPWPDDVVRIEYLDLVLRGGDAALAPRVIVQLGAPTTLELVARVEACKVSTDLIVVGPTGWGDPTGRAVVRLLGDIDSALRALVPRLAQHSPDHTYARSLAAANTTMQALVDSHLQSTAFGEGQAVACAVRALPKGSLLIVGNSLAVREVDNFCHAADRSLQVIHQRGASGIDGNIALAAGASQAHGGAALLLIGDVSFLHDVGSFIAARSIAQSLVIVVLQNGGGRIFEQLPLSKVRGLERRVMDLVTTPHQFDFASVAQFAGAEFKRVHNERDLERSLLENVGRPGITLIEVVVPTSGAQVQNATLWSAAKTAGSVSAVPQKS